MRILVAILLLLTAFVPAHAAGRDDVYQRCLDESGGVDPVMKRCGADAIARQDKVLNAAYARLRLRLAPPLKANLQDAERAWLAYRQAQCHFEYERRQPGTMGGLLYQSCVLALTARRIADLKELRGLVDSGR